MATDERVRDRLSGKLLDFSVVGGREAKAGGLADADPDERYIAVQLPRPVPAEGARSACSSRRRTRIPRATSWRRNEVVFTRSLGIKRNAVVLPAGYELVSCNVPAQVRRRTTAASW